MLRLVLTQDETPDQSDANQPPADYRRAQAYRRLDQLLFRVLQLDEILHHRCTFNPEKARRIKTQIETVQQKLDRVYTKIDEGQSRRAMMHRVAPTPGVN